MLNPRTVYNLFLDPLVQRLRSSGRRKSCRVNEIIVLTYSFKADCECGRHYKFLEC